jgi:hypothetical protein
LYYHVIIQAKKAFNKDNSSQRHKSIEEQQDIACITSYTTELSIIVCVIHCHLGSIKNGQHEREQH